MGRETVQIVMPERVINPHAHGRDLSEAHKITVRQLLSESARAMVDITGFMPNTQPPIDRISVLKWYLELVDEAACDLKLPHPQYLWFGATDQNQEERRKAFRDYRKRLMGIKGYPLSKNGQGVTTGTSGVSSKEGVEQCLQDAMDFDTVVCFHCDQPAAKSHFGESNEASALAYIGWVLGIARRFPGVKVYIPHVPTKRCVDLIRRHRDKGLRVMFGICPHYLLFDKERTNWNPQLSPEFYKCFNPLGSAADRVALGQTMKTDWDSVILEADSACHTTAEKLAGDPTSAPGGIPSHQHLVPVAVLMAIELDLEADQLAAMLCWNAADFFRIQVPRTKHIATFHHREDDFVTYNHGQVTNPFRGLKVWFPSSMLS